VPKARAAESSLRVQPVTETIEKRLDKLLKRIASRFDSKVDRKNLWLYSKNHTIKKW
jgi:hypothetical protein